MLATAGSAQKRAYLRQQGLATVVSSRSLHFAEHLGCREGMQPSVLLNSLTSPGLWASSTSVMLLAGLTFPPNGVVNWSPPWTLWPPHIVCA